MEKLKDWDDDQDAIIKKINERSPLKIVMKQKNEHELLENWIVHHGEIVGYENLIIADNGSDDDRIFQIYDKYDSKINIFSFRGRHNDIHNYNRFKGLFEAIRTTSDFCTFIDADEQLCLIDGNGWSKSADVKELIARQDKNAIIPSIWLNNANQSFTEFSLRTDLDSNLRWGKPIIPTPILGLESRIHNVQFKGFDFNAQIGARIFLLHMTDMPERRLRANHNKLASRGFSDIDELVSSVAAGGTEHIDQNSVLLVQEIIKIRHEMTLDEESREKNAHTLVMRDGGRYTIDTEYHDKLFKAFIENGSRKIDEILNSAFNEGDNCPSADELEVQKKEYNQRGIVEFEKIIDRRINKLYA